VTSHVWLSYTSSRADESEVICHVWLSYTSSRADESEVTSHVWLSYTSSSGVIELVFHFASTK